MLCVLASSLPHDHLEDMRGVGGGGWADQNSELLGEVRAGIPVRAHLMAQAVSATNGRALCVSSRIMPEVGSYLSSWGKVRGSATSMRTPADHWVLGASGRNQGVQDGQPTMGGGRMLHTASPRHTEN